MDHLNFTVAKDGALVATRRGLQVSKQKHRGLSFVNSYAPPDDSTSRQPAARKAPTKTTSVDLGQPLTQRWKFVTKETETRKAGAKPKSKPVVAPERGNQTRKTARRHPPGSTPAAVKRLPSPNASSSDSDRSESGPFVYVDDFNRPVVPGGDRPVPSLPEWTTIRLPLSERDQRLFFNFYALVPRKMYPFEDIFLYNPARSPDFYWMVINDPAAVHCVLMCNSMFRSVLSGKMDSEELAYQISQICKIINRQLDKLPTKIPNITLECITTLALMGNLIGRYDHWHVHMTGLKKMVEMNGGWEGLRPALISKIRKTDIKGAATLGNSPYLPFVRCHDNISDVLPSSIRTSTAAALHAALTPLSIAPEVAESISALSLFVQAVALAQDARPERSVLFDPHAFTESLQWVQHSLVVHPGPLRRDDAAGCPPVDTRRLKTENYILNHQVPLTVPVVPAPLRPGSGPLEPAVRICGLLYLKELAPDFPRNLGGYSVLLTLLRHHVRAALLPRRAGRQSVDEEQRDKWPHHLLRPVAIWVCLVGDAISRVADANECRFGSDCYERGIFADALADLLEGSGGATDEDLLLCRLLDLRRIQGERWDDRAELSRMLVQGTVRRRNSSSPSSGT